MDLVFIYGPPAAGKLTIGEELARLTGFGLFHNHLSIDFVRPVFEFRTPAFFQLVDKVRLAVFEAAAKEGVSLIFTYVYVHPSDGPFLDRVFETVEGNGGHVCPVQLTCDPNRAARTSGSAEQS